jgi:hypothetical protein
MLLNRALTTTDILPYNNHSSSLPYLHNSHLYQGASAAAAPPPGDPLMPSSSEQWIHPTDVRGGGEPRHGVLVNTHAIEGKKQQQQQQRLAYDKIY